MKLLKKIPKLKKAGFKEWPAKIASVFFRFENGLKKTAASSRNRFVFIAAVMLIIVLSELGAGFTLLFQANQRLIKRDPLDEELRIISELKSGLGQLPVVYNDKLAGLATGSPKLIVNQLTRFTGKLLASGNTSPEIRFLKDSLKRIAGYLSEPVAFQNYYQIWAEVEKSRLYLGNYEAKIRALRQKPPAVSMENLWLPVASGLFLLIAAFLWLCLVFKEVKGHQKALKHYEQLAQEFKEGKLEPKTVPYNTAEFSNLQTALNGYIQRLTDRYQVIISEVEGLAPLIRQLGEWLTCNEDQHLKIKDNLKDTVGEAYQRLEQFPDLAERIKSRNINLETSQREIAQLLESVESFRESQERELSLLMPVSAGIEQKGRYFEEVRDKLRELKSLLEQIQQTIAVFYGISEQTRLLALNASIEAARAGGIGGDFGFAAQEIEELAVKITAASKNLTNMAALINKKTTAALRLLEISLTQNKLEKKNLDELLTPLRNYGDSFLNYLHQLNGYVYLVEKLESKGQSIEKSIANLNSLKDQGPENYHRTMAALDVIIETDKLVASAGELDDQIEELKQRLSKIYYKPVLEES
ncbi:MAG: methyl-accepting chemotaxis protein [Bacillota bacterium]